MMGRLTFSLTSKMFTVALVALVLLITSATVLHVHQRLGEISGALPVTLSAQERGIASILSEMHHLDGLVAIALFDPSPERIEGVLKQTEVVDRLLTDIRATYKLDNLLGAAAVHAVINPALFDIQNWLKEGVQGIPSDSFVVLTLVSERVRTARRETEALYRAATATASEILNHEIERLADLRRAVMVAFLVLAVVSALLVVFVLRGHHAETALRESDLKYRSLFSAEPDAIILAQAENAQLLDANDAALELYGYEREEFLSLTALDISNEPEETMNKLTSWEIGKILNIPLRYHRKKDGTVFPVEISASFFELGGRKVLCAAIRDITERKLDEERIHYQANFDALTGLPNRAMFHDRLDHDLPNMERAKKKLALLFIDLDDFKLVNDSFGHDAGDLLLKEASERLIGCVRDGDTVARLGGDEFTVIMPNLDDPHNAPLVAQRVLDALAKPFILKGHEAFVSASIGITVFPDDTEEAGELLKNADAAMYSAKEQGKANYQFFTSLNKEVKERLILKNDLSKALERQDFRLHYQPKLDIKSGNIMGVEALIRWNSPELGPVSPVKFIPILEETGGVVEAGEWAIRMACRQHKDWLEAGLHHIRVAVNLSARHIREPSFVSNVEKVLAEIGIEPSGLEIEITESMLMSDTAKTASALNELHEMGIHVAMDDFGTGYSSLNYLKRFPIDTIKIDRSFVSDITTSPDDAEIIRTIIIMGKTLNMRVVAEGVETEEQLAMLKRYECDEIQGNFFSRPLSADKLTLFLKQRSAPSGRSAKAAAGGE